MKTTHETTDKQHEEFVNRMWALFLAQNANPNPDIDGMFDLGKISDACPKRWSKATAYSVAQTRKEKHGQHFEADDPEQSAPDSR